MHADVLERAQACLDRRSDLKQIRQSTAEHLFSTLKSWMGSPHFQRKTIPKVSTEMGLQVLAYKMKGAINLVETRRIMETVTA